MATEADKYRKLDLDEIQIPPGPRLGRLVVEAARLAKGFDGRLLIDDLTLSLPRGGIVGVIGPNAVGKTTLFKILAGEESPDAGTIRIGDTVRVSYVDQDRARMRPDRTAWELVSGGDDFIQVGQVEMPSRAYLAAFGFKGPDQQKPARLCSGGERNRLNLALTLRQGGNLLLLDEPTNDLDIETLSSLENALLRFPGCAVITAHDRWVPGPDRHPHPGPGGHRGRASEVVLVRGQLRGVREEQDRPARRGRPPPPPGDPPQTHPRLTHGLVQRQSAPAPRKTRRPSLRIGVRRVQNRERR